MSILAVLQQRLGVTDEIEACAALVSKYFKKEVSGLSAVNLWTLAASRDISIDRDAEIQYEGCIERDAFGRAYIKLRRGLNRRRERFTLAHELGHWLLQEEMLGTCEGTLFRGLSATPKELEEEERLANLLAAEMLLPSEALSKSFDENQLHRSLNAICREYVLSRTMAVRRIADVCNVNIAFIQIMPYMFDCWNSSSQVDDAILVTSRKGTLFARESTCFAKPLSFESIARSGGRVGLAIKTPKGLLETNFETLLRREPIPHVYAIATIDCWPDDR